VYSFGYILARDVLAPDLNRQFLDLIHGRIEGLGRDADGHCASQLIVKSLNVGVGDEAIQGIGDLPNLYQRRLGVFHHDCQVRSAEIIRVGGSPALLGAAEGMLGAGVASTYSYCPHARSS
jgi:hypothetical protein